MFSSERNTSMFFFDSCTTAATHGRSQGDVIQRHYMRRIRTRGTGGTVAYQMSVFTVVDTVFNRTASSTIQTNITSYTSYYIMLIKRYNVYSKLFRITHMIIFLKMSPYLLFKLIYRFIIMSLNGITISINY